MPTGVRPWLVGLARAALHAVLLAAAVAAFHVVSNALQGPGVPMWLQLYAPLIVAVLRAAEGALDDKASGGAPQAGLLKGGPITPTE